jgi:hypothetical protein
MRNCTQQRSAGGLVADLQKQRDAALAKINRVLADVGVGSASRTLGSLGC